jgi:hypothetical protein
MSGATATIGTATGTATYGLGIGATTTGLAKTLDLGTGGTSGSTTVVNIGSATPGAGGTTVINTPTVTFANAVTQVGMPQANLTAQLLGLGGATADSTNRLSVNTPAVLLNNAGSGIEATVNKAATGNDAAFAFKTGFSARALFGLLGSDDVTLKVSPDGSSYFDALIADRSTGRVSFPAGIALAGLAADQDVPWLAPAAGDYALSTTGAGGAATGTLAGAANRMDLFPFIPRDDLTLDRLAVNVTTLIAGALGKIAEAKSALGRHEARDRSWLMDWLKRDGRSLGDPAKNPWCGDFVETCIRIALPDEPLLGALGSNPYWARNWLRFGQEVQPIFGAVLVFERGSGGHVGFAIGQGAVTHEAASEAGHMSAPDDAPKSALKIPLAQGAVTHVAVQDQVEPLVTKVAENICGDWGAGACSSVRAR